MGMQDSSNSLINDSSKTDMATISKAVGEFRASEGEDIERWLSDAEVTGTLCGLAESELIKVVILALRNEPREWAMDLIRSSPNITWRELEAALKTRFVSQKQVTETVSIF